MRYLLDTSAPELVLQQDLTTPAAGRSSGNYAGIYYFARSLAAL